MFPSLQNPAIIRRLGRTPYGTALRGIIVPQQSLPTVGYGRIHYHTKTMMLSMMMTITLSLTPQAPMLNPQYIGFAIFPDHHHHQAYHISKAPCTCFETHELLCSQMEHEGT